MAALSFFARGAYVDGNKKRLMGGSSLIRAEQIAGYLGAKLNPTDGYENDVCIHVKPDMDKNGLPINTFAKNSYIDIIDYKEYVDWLRRDPKLSGIVASQHSYDILQKYKLNNKIVFIPQQHCNFDRIIRDRSEIKNVGIIGAPRTFQYPIDEIRDCLAKIGLNLLVNTDFSTRAEVVDFYKNIDIQIIWDKIYRLLKNPLKIINAASFGIPTVGHPHKGYKEVEGYYLKTLTIETLVAEVEKLKNPDYYAKASAGLIIFAENYHISKVADKYLQLVTQICI